MATDRKILLGYEMATGRRVTIPVRHMVVTGITQESGKTTTLEALAGRAGRPVLCFRTKRGEESFATARTIPARLVPSAEWPEVEALLTAMLSSRGAQESLRPMRYMLVRACEGSNTLAEVSKKLSELAAKETTQSAIRQSYLLKSYLHSILDDLKAAGAQVDVHSEDAALDLQVGVQCMDLIGLPYHLQAIAIANALDWVTEHAEDTVVIIPEAWEMLPLGRPTPCRMAAERLLRKGACCGNVMWLDSQDLAAIYPPARKACSVYLLGVQRADMEVERTLRHLRSLDARCPTAEDVMELRRGWFYYSSGEDLDLVYVQPAWLDQDPERARTFAREPMPESYVMRKKAKRRKNAGAADAQPEPEIAEMKTMGGVQ